MKRTITLFTLLLLTGMILPSCGLTIVKREHTRGYYVSTNHRYHTDKDEAAIKPDEKEFVASTQSTAEETPAAINEQVNASEAEAMDKQKDAVPDGRVETSPTKRKFSLRSIADKAPMMEKIVTKSKKGISKPNAQAGEELSLIWIVILVLLVLWALGLIGGGWGLGWVINVLLVIALVLLILWLLRIV